MTTTSITSGQSVTGLTIASGDTLLVSSGGTALDTTILSDGSETVFAGGSDSGATVSAGGTFTVSAGGVALDTLAVSPATAVISSGGIEAGTSGAAADGVTVLLGGSLQALASGAALYDTVSSGGSAVASSGGRVDSTTIAAGGSLTVNAGGSASSDAISGSGAAAQVAGSAFALEIAAGGSDVVVSGGVASASMLSSGGAEIVASGGVATATEIFAGGSLTVSSGGVAEGAGLAGSATVSAGGTASGTHLVSGGQLLIASGGIGVATTIVSGSETVAFGGTDSGTTISSGGSESVASGGIASATGVLSGAVLVVSSGGSAVDTNATAGASAVILAGGVEQATSGSASLFVTLSGGSELVSANARAVETMLVGGSLGVQSGGTASNSTVMSGGVIVVSGGGSAIDTTLSSGGSETVLSGGFDSFARVGAGVSMTVSSGGNEFGGGVNAGATVTILAGGTGSSMSLYGGTLEIASGGTLAGTLGFGYNQGGVLRLDDNVPPAATLDAFHQFGGSGETIDLAGLGFASFGNAVLGGSNVLSVTQGGTTDTLQLNPAMVYAGAFVMASDGSGGTQITNNPPCYVAGTRIATPGGEMRVEDVRAGDAVLADTGAGWQVRTVRWVGRVTVDLVRHPCPARAAPVRIRAHAVAPDVPRRDLLVSPDHAIFLDGVLIQAQALRNGATVVQDFPARVTYYHIELDCHALLCAEGLAAESYLETGNRGLFAGAAGVRPLHADLAGAAAWDERAVAPLLLGGARVAAAQAGVRARAEALGWRLGADPDLRVLADGVALALDVEGRAALPPGAGTIRLTSRRFVPRWLGLADDGRRLGVAVAALRLDGRALAPAAFGRGWHAAEAGWRWTDGDAHLALPVAAARTLTLRLAAAGARYWQPPQPLPPPKALKVMSV